MEPVNTLLLLGSLNRLPHKLNVNKRIDKTLVFQDYCISTVGFYLRAKTQPFKPVPRLTPSGHSTYPHRLHSPLTKSTGLGTEILPFTYLGLRPKDHIHNPRSL